MIALVNHAIVALQVLAVAAVITIACMAASAPTPINYVVTAPDTLA